MTYEKDALPLFLSVYQLDCIPQCNTNLARRRCLFKLAAFICSCVRLRSGHIQTINESLFLGRTLVRRLQSMSSLSPQLLYKLKKAFFLQGDTGTTHLSCSPFKFGCWDWEVKGIGALDSLRGACQLGGVGKCIQKCMICCFNLTIMFTQTKHTGVDEPELVLNKSVRCENALIRI